MELVLNKINKSLAMQARAKKRIPGMCQLLSKRPDMFSQGVWPGYYSKAKGVNVWDLDGNKYVDMSISAIGAAVLGYADDEVDSVVCEAISKGVVASFNCPEEVELAELLCELHPWADMVRFARAGGEAMGMAVRIARASTKRNIIAFCGYHGWQDWYLAANLGTGNELNEHLLTGLDPAGVPSHLGGTALPFRYNQLDELEAIVQHHGDDLAAIVMEPTRNLEPDEGFFDGVRTLAKKSGAVFIIDEISAGFRIITGGAHLAMDYIEPDMAVFAKAMGNGYAISSVIGKSKVMQAAQESFISSTNWTERVGFSAAIATINKFREKNVAEHLVQLGSFVMESWEELAVKHGLKLHAGGMKPMAHFSIDHEEFPSLKAYYVQLMLERGFLASNLFYATYAHTKEHVDHYLQATDEAFALMAQALEKKIWQIDFVANLLKPCSSGSIDFTLLCSFSF